MDPWRLLFSCLLLKACLAVEGSVEESSRQRRSTSDTECEHDGVRVDTESGPICLCPTGYTGTSCEAETEISAITKLSDLNVQDGGVFVCAGKVCILQINVDVANNNKTITITGDPDQSDIRIFESPLANKFKFKFGQIDILRIQTIVRSDSGKPAKMIFNVLQDNNKVDSVSYKFQFVEKPSTTVTDFADANVPGGSRLVCDGFCRLLVVSRPLPNNTCSQVDALCGSAWSFPTFLSGFSCYTEIVFQSDPCQKLCFNVRDTQSNLCYWRLPYEDSASCGCDPLCSNITLEYVCCPQNRSVNVCDEPETGLSSAVVAGISVGTSLSALIAILVVVGFLKFRATLKSKVDSQPDAPGDQEEKTETQKKNEEEKTSNTG